MPLPTTQITAAILRNTFSIDTANMELAEKVARFNSLTARIAAAISAKEGALDDEERDNLMHDIHTMCEQHLAVGMEIQADVTAAITVVTHASHR